MRSVRVRLTIWFGLTLFAIVALWVGCTYYYLESELRHKKWQTDYPSHPDWKLHGSFSEAEVRDILGEMLETNLAWAIPLTLATLGVGWWLARKSLRPIAIINDQLRSIGPKKLSRRIELVEMDGELRDLVRHLNELLGRLEGSFTEMSEYAAKVAHELRTPLSILRLKVEQAGAKIPPDFAEEFQSQLQHLTHVIEQSLLIAKAEQGRLALQAEPIDLSNMTAEIAEDFLLLAQEQGRNILLTGKVPRTVTVDPKYARQMLHNLLSNALKHGEGDIKLRLSARSGAPVLSMLNRVRHEPDPSRATLGLGLRVVDTLLHLQPGVKCARRQGKHYYAVRLAFAA